MKRLSSRAHHYPLCGSPSKKKGFTSSGTQRWYCTKCRYSFTTQRCDHAKEQQFLQFLAYLTDTSPRRSQGQSLRTWDRSHAWCENTSPVWQVTGEVFQHPNTNQTPTSPSKSTTPSITNNHGKTASPSEKAGFEANDTPALDPRFVY